MKHTPHIFSIADGAPECLAATDTHKKHAGCGKNHAAAGRKDTLCFFRVCASESPTLLVRRHLEVYTATKHHMNITYTFVHLCYITTAASIASKSLYYLCGVRCSTFTARKTHRTIRANSRVYCPGLVRMLRSCRPIHWPPADANLPGNLPQRRRRRDLLAIRSFVYCGRRRRRRRRP